MKKLITVVLISIIVINLMGCNSATKVNTVSQTSNANCLNELYVFMGMKIDEAQKIWKAENIKCTVLDVDGMYEQSYTFKNVSFCVNNNTIESIIVDYEKAENKEFASVSKINGNDDFKSINKKLGEGKVKYYNLKDEVTGVFMASKSVAIKFNFGKNSKVSLINVFIDSSNGENIKS